MLRHALPEVHQKFLDLMEVGPNHAVQNTLAVGSVHEEEGIHLKGKSWTRRRGRGGGGNWKQESESMTLNVGFR